MVGEVMYIHTPFPNRVFALDLNTPGRVLWRYEPTQDPSVIGVMCCDTVNRGPAYADGKIILSQADTTVVALDAKTGREVWKVKNGDPAKGETATMAPMVFGDKVHDRHLRRRIRHPRPCHRVQPGGRKAGLARLLRRVG